ncbi:MAG TPA: TIGR04282 family arsenosugar biosynthesis glycosyltransferase [Thermomicrobiales bacterium]|jgi:rSAM/selenodomain-associated transferase 1
MSDIVVPRDALYIAAKAPRPGLAKTRLGRQLGHQAAVELYRAFLRDLSLRFASLPRNLSCTLGWYITPPDAWPELAPLVTIPEGMQTPVILAQGEGDWTTRQEALFAGAEGRGEGRTILIASDSPHLNVSTIASAFRQLERHDLVLGPVSDGGYYLIGMRGWHDVLRGIPMSTQTVTSEIAARAAQQGLSVGWTAPTFDIDEATDLAQLCRLVATRDDLPATRAALRQPGLLTAGPAPAAPSLADHFTTASPHVITGLSD